MDELHERETVADEREVDLLKPETEPLQGYPVKLENDHVSTRWC
jgi:hypothetical protein